jgi:hypothetical protein
MSSGRRPVAGRQLHAERRPETTRPGSAPAVAPPAGTARKPAPRAHTQHASL